MSRRLAALLILFAACAKPPDGEQLRKTTVSWSASLEIAANAWLAGRLPDHFLSAVVDGAVDELGNQSRSSQAIPPLLTHATARTIALAHEIDDAVKHHDRAAAARDVRELATIRRGLQQ